MFVTRKTYDAVVRERDEALALVAKLTSENTRCKSANAFTLKALEVRGYKLADMADQREGAELAAAAKIARLEGELSRAYVHDARGRIARHPLNTGGKVKA